MIIDYKKPYWLKFMCDIETIRELGDIRKENKELQNILFEEDYSIICNFRIGKEFLKDTKAGIFGKAGQNYGLNFDSDIDSLVFEFRTNNPSPKFNCLIFSKINSDIIDKGIKLVIIKTKKNLIFYLDGKLIKYYTYDDEFIEEYRDAPFFIGALNPGADDPKDRCYSQIDITLFAIVKKEININKLKKIDKKDKNVLCYYDFETINLRKDVYDESINFNLLELVPQEYIK